MRNAALVNPCFLRYLLLGQSEEVASEDLPHFMWRYLYRHDNDPYTLNDRRYEEVDINKDGIKDISIKLVDIVFGKAKLTFIKLAEKVEPVEEIPEEEIVPEEIPEEEIQPEVKPPVEVRRKIAYTTIIIIAIIIILAIIIYIVMKKKRPAA